VEEAILAVEQTVGGRIILAALPMQDISRDPLYRHRCWLN
jgi:hypothetical protein